MRKALGRGLEALIPNENKQISEEDEKIRHYSQLRKVPINSIRPNHLQPRKNFDPQKLSELAQSIKEHGLTQPIAVSYDSVSDSYEIISGERRLKACQLAGMTHIDAIIKTPTSEKHRLALALIENIQRDDLNAVEAALAYQKLIRDFSVSQTDLSQYLGKSKSSISNTLRILELSDNILKAVQIDQITEGHARALLTLSDPIEREELFHRIIKEMLSVRDTENIARSNSIKNKPIKIKNIAKKSADVLVWEKELEHILGTKVAVNTKNNRGTIVVHFYNLADFERIVKMIKK